MNYLTPLNPNFSSQANFALSHFYSQKALELSQFITTIPIYSHLHLSFSDNDPTIPSRAVVEIDQLLHFICTRALANLPILTASEKKALSIYLEKITGCQEIILPNRFNQILLADLSRLLRALLSTASVLFARAIAQLNKETDQKRSFQKKVYDKKVYAKKLAKEKLLLKKNSSEKLLEKRQTQRLIRETNSQELAQFKSVSKLASKKSKKETHRVGAFLEQFLKNYWGTSLVEPVLFSLYHV